MKDKMENGRPRREKGKRGELEARDLWRRWFPDCQRIYGQSRKGSDAPDIGCAEMNLHYYVEVKRYKKITDGMIRRLYEKADSDHCAQFVEHPESDPMLVLMFRQDNEPWYVALWHWDAHDLDLEGDTEYLIHCMATHLCIIPWSDFSAALDKIHGGKDE